MPVPFGFGVGDFVAVGTLAWNVYKSCKGAPGSFENISTEVLSLHAVLKEGEEILFVQPLPTARAERLNIIKQGCEKVLVDLQNLVDRYESLGTQSKRTWDRMRWGNEDVAEIRARLTSNISLLTAFISTSQVSVETKLDRFIEEFRQGKKETSIVSLQTVDSLSADDRAVWRTIRKELEEIGISVAAFDANRTFIFDWFVRAIEAGAFEEQNAHSTDDEGQYSDNQACESSEAGDDRDIGQQTENSDSESPESTHGGQQPGSQQPSKSAHDSEAVSPKRGSSSFEQISASTHPGQRNKIRIPRIADLMAVMLRPRQRLMKAVVTGDLSKALWIVESDTSIRLLDIETLNRALWSTTCQGEKDGSDLLLASLIAHGANVNYVSSDPHERTPLWNSVANGSFDTVRLLVKNGVDVNYKGSDRHRLSSEASNFAPRAALKQSQAMLRLLISSGVDVNVLYDKALETDHRWGLLCGHPGHGSDKICLIHEAAFLGAVSAIEALLECGAEINATSPLCGTALMAALVNQQAEAAEFLLFRGANPNSVIARSPFSVNQRCYQTPIEAAMVGGSASMVRLLLRKGAVPNIFTLDYMRSARIYRKYGRLQEFGEDEEIEKVLTEAWNNKLLPSPPFWPR